MFMDVVVIAGVGTVGLMVAFFAGFGYFVWKDAHKVKAPATPKRDRTFQLQGTQGNFGRLRSPIFLRAPGMARCA